MNKIIIFLNAVIMFLSGCAQQQTDTKEFSQYEYEYSIEQLQENFSAAMMEDAAKDLEELERVNTRGAYSGTLTSIETHETPEWFLDNKLGIFYDWGLYSVPGYGVKEWNRAAYPDWYLFHMYHGLKDYHRETWGVDFHRDDFIPMFTAENFDANEIVDLVKMSGAKYLIPFNKHHDGFCLWDSRYTHRDVVDMVPGRDLTAELVEACRKENIRHGFYFSVDEYEYPMIDDQGELYIRYWPEESETGKNTGEFIPDKHNRMLSGKVPVKDFIDDYIVPQAKEFIDRYDPDILWFDGEWQMPSDYYRTPDITAYFYNKAEGRKKVAVNDRLGKETREVHGDYHTSETDVVVDKTDYPWEECRSMSGSYGYNRAETLENYLTADELIQMLVRIVAKGGNLNLLVNPDGSGKIPRIQIELLEKLGNWLKVNGEAIYETRPYEKICDNTQLGQPVWYTMSKDSTYAYAIVFDWPRSETFLLHEANPKWDTKVYMLGYDEPIEWVDTGRDLWGLSAKVPEEMVEDPSSRPCEHAWVLRFEYDKNDEFGK